MSKIERGRDEDLSDVLALLKAGRIDVLQLKKYFDEVLPRIETHSLKGDPIEFGRKFQALQQAWQESKI